MFYTSQRSHLEVLLLSKFWSERGDFDWCWFWASYVGMFFDAVVVFVTSHTLLFRFAVSILWACKNLMQIGTLKLSAKKTLFLQIPITSWLLLTCWIGNILKTGSDIIIYWLSRHSFLLGFIMSKKTERSVILFSNQKFTTQPLAFFWHNKTQKERVSTESINYHIR